MPDDTKPPMFGPSANIDPATYEPRAGKTFWFDPKDNGHTLIFAPTRSGVPVDYSAIGLTDAEIAAAKIVDRD